MVITEVELSSSIGEDMVYTHAVGEELGPMGVDNWWVDPRPVWTSAKKRAKDKVIELDRMPEWGDLDLDWQAGQEKENSTVLFADFNKNDDK